MDSKSSAPPAAGSPGAGPHAPRASFGRHLSEHHLVQRFRDGRWGEAAIEPVGTLALPLQARALHYAQAVFEGFKAHRLPDGSVALFRPDAHLARLNRSAARLCLPPLDAAATLDAIRRLVARDRDRVPAAPRSLYVRPLLFADDADLNAGPGTSATLLVMTAPVEAFFGSTEGLRLRTETRYVRAFPGGTGSIKAAGNYAAAMAAQLAAREEGYHEVVWLDALDRARVEETGAMNLFVVRDGTLLTPPAGDTVLPGVTRASLLRLASDLDLDVREEDVPVDAAWWGGVTEVFSSGTAVGCTAIASIDHEGGPLLRSGGERRVQSLLAKALTDLKEGRAPDPYGWRVGC